MVYKFVWSGDELLKLEPVGSFMEYQNPNSLTNLYKQYAAQPNLVVGYYDADTHSIEQTIEQGHTAPERLIAAIQQQIENKRVQGAILAAGNVSGETANPSTENLSHLSSPVPGPQVLIKDAVYGIDPRQVSKFIWTPQEIVVWPYSDDTRHHYDVLQELGYTQQSGTWAAGVYYQQNNYLRVIEHSGLIPNTKQLIAAIQSQLSKQSSLDNQVPPPGNDLWGHHSLTPIPLSEIAAVSEKFAEAGPIIKYFDSGPVYTHDPDHIAWIYNSTINTLYVSLGGHHGDLIDSVYKDDPNVIEYEFGGSEGIWGGDIFAMNDVYGGGWQPTIMVEGNSEEMPPSHPLFHTLKQIADKFNSAQVKPNPGKNSSISQKFSGVSLFVTPDVPNQYVIKTDDKTGFLQFKVEDIVDILSGNPNSGPYLFPGSSAQQGIYIVMWNSFKPNSGIQMLLALRQFAEEHRYPIYADFVDSVLKGKADRIFRSGSHPKEAAKVPSQVRWIYNPDTEELFHGDAQKATHYQLAQQNGIADEWYKTEWGGKGFTDFNAGFYWPGENKLLSITHEDDHSLNPVIQQRLQSIYNPGSADSSEDPPHDSGDPPRLSVQRNAGIFDRIFNKPDPDPPTVRSYEGNQYLDVDTHNAVIYDPAANTLYISWGGHHYGLCQALFQEGMTIDQMGRCGFYEAAGKQIWPDAGYATNAKALLGKVKPAYLQALQAKQESIQMMEKGNNDGFDDKYTKNSSADNLDNLALSVRKHASIIGSFIWDNGKVYWDRLNYHYGILERNPHLLEDWSHLVFGQVHKWNSDHCTVDFDSDYMNEEEGSWIDEDEYEPPTYNQGLKNNDTRFAVFQDVADATNQTIENHGVIFYPSEKSAKTAANGLVEYDGSTEIDGATRRPWMEVGKYVYIGQPGEQHSKLWAQHRFPSDAVASYSGYFFEPNILYFYNADQIDPVIKQSIMSKLTPLLLTTRQYLSSFLDFYRQEKQKEQENEITGPVSRFPIPDEAVRRSIYYHQCPMCRGYLRGNGDFWRCDDCPYEAEWPQKNINHEQNTPEITESGGNLSDGVHKQASLPYKFVWADGELVVGPGYKGDLHHHQLLTEMGYENSKPAALVAGDYIESDYHVGQDNYPIPYLKIIYHWGLTPSNDQLIAEIKQKIHA